MHDSGYRFRLIVGFPHTLGDHCFPYNTSDRFGGGMNGVSNRVFDFEGLSDCPHCSLLSSLDKNVDAMLSYLERTITFDTYGNSCRFIDLLEL